LYFQSTERAPRRLPHSTRQIGGVSVERDLGDRTWLRPLGGGTVGQSTLFPFETIVERMLNSHIRTRATYTAIV